MLDTATAAPSSTSPEAESPDWVGGSRASPARVGHVVCCQADHDATKALVREWLDITVNYPDLAPDFLTALSGDEQRRFSAYLTGRKPWPGTTLVAWNCVCHSTLAVCAECRDEGMVETKGREVQCDCFEVVA
jgi:hypothetical protein